MSKSIHLCLTCRLNNKLQLKTYCSCSSYLLFFNVNDVVEHIIMSDFDKLVIGLPN